MGPILQSDLQNNSKDLIQFLSSDDKEWDSETRIYGNMRLWHLIGLCAGGVLTLVVACCCICKFRIPRTRKEMKQRQLEGKSRLCSLLNREKEGKIGKQRCADI
ncbi:unnamed protein product [Clavelina lepadiformis]|uniref:Transmembrane inner ear expressed protein n=1 Tax=Clavelina lepadiformis TaxID=159417 RepID=A0ABP0GL31_CLALP